jgi:hypothetical protein
MLRLAMSLLTGIRALFGVRTAAARSRSLALGGAIALAAIPSNAAAAPFEVGDTTWEGGSELYELVRAELGESRVKPVGVLDWDEVRAEDGILVVHPLQEMDLTEAREFMLAGGRLAIVDDYGEGDELLKRFGIERTTSPTRPVSALRNKPELAIAEPVLDEVAGRSWGPHPVVTDVQRLVTNHPTGLTNPDLSPVLRIRAIGEPDVIISVAGQVGQGRLFAMSDPSALINLMLRYPGNRAFVTGLARYLVNESGTGQRQGRLFIVVGRFSEEGAFAGKTTLAKDLESQLRALTTWLSDMRRDGLPGWLLVALAALMVLGLGAWVHRSSSRPYKNPLPRYARPIPLIAQGGVAGRFALLAAPSSPRSLALMELKSALFETIAERFHLAPQPSSEAVLRAVVDSGHIDERLQQELVELLALMKRIEASVVVGRPANLPRAAVHRAGRVVREVLVACGTSAGPSAEPPPSTRRLTTMRGEPAG